MGRDDVRQSVGIFNNRLKKTPPYLRGVRGLSDEHNVANNDFMRSQPKTNPHRSEVNNPNRPPLIPLENIKSSKDYVTLGEAKERAQQWSAQAQELRSREKHSREATQMPHDPSLFQRNQNQATEQAVAAEKGSPRKRAKDASCIGPDPERRYTIPVRPRTQAISPGSLETSQYWNQPQYRSWTERITPENVARPDPFPYYDFDHPGETYEEWETRFNAYENSRRRWRENMYDRLFAQPQHPTSGEEKPEAEDGSSPSLNSLPSPIKKVISDIKTPKRPYQPTVSSDLPETEVNPDISRQDSKGHTSNETLQSLPSLFSVALSSEDHPAIADKPHDIPRFQKPVITSSKKDQACQNPKIPDIVAPADRPIPGSIDDLPPHLLQAIDGERKNVKSENQTQMQDRAYSRPSTKRARLDQPHDFAEVVHRDLARRERKSLRRQTLVKPKASVSLPKPSRSPITCPFFQLLPLELRHLIYRQLLCAKKIFRGGELVEDKRTTVVVSEDPHPAFNLGIDATFFRTCRKMYCEALPILYQENWFGFSEVRMLKTFRTKGLPEKRKSSSLLIKVGDFLIT